MDGLRAVAVLPVILFHAGIGLFGGGYVGVDVFFVISGYLITSIILPDLAAGRFSLAAFYERRARRILPALFLVMLTCIGFAWFWLLPGDMRDLSRSVIAVILSLSNVLFWLESGYFGGAAELKPLLHTWSLAVEEQYYLLFPALMLLLWPLGRRRLWGVLAATALATLVLAHGVAFHWPEAGFFLLPTRVWELLLGALVALYLSRPGRAVAGRLAREFGSVAGLALIAAAILAYDARTPYPSLYTLVPTTGAALVILLATPDTVVARVLGNPLLAGIGLISYSAYLWHQPLLVFARYLGYGIHGPAGLLALLLVVFVLAYLTWRFIERPFRGGRHFNRRQVFGMAGVAGVILLGFGAAGLWTHGFEGRLSASQRAVMAFENYAYAPVYRDGTCFLQSDQGPGHFADECGRTLTGGLLIWGDSHAAALSHGLRQHIADTLQYTSARCPPLLGVSIPERPNCGEVNAFVIGEIRRLHPRTVLLHANWSTYWDMDPLPSLARTLAALRSAAPDAKIVIVGSVPQWSPSLPVVAARRKLPLVDGGYLPNPKLRELQYLDQQLLAVGAKQGASFVSALDRLCRSGKCLAAVQRQDQVELTAWDHSHLTAGGALFLAGKMVGAAPGL